MVRYGADRPRQAHRCCRMEGWPEIPFVCAKELSSRQGSHWARPEENALTAAVVAAVRHRHIRYDRLLAWARPDECSGGRPAILRPLNQRHTIPWFDAVAVETIIAGYSQTTGSRTDDTFLRGFDRPAANARHLGERWRATVDTDSRITSDAVAGVERVGAADRVA